MTILETFMSSENGLTFNDYLDMLDAFHEKKSFEVKRDTMFEILKNLSPDEKSNDRKRAYLSRLSLEKYFANILPDVDPEVAIKFNNEKEKSDMVKVIVDEVVKEAMDVDVEMEGNEREMQRQERWISKHQFDKIMGSCQERFVQGFSLGVM